MNAEDSKPPAGEQRQSVSLAELAAGIRLTTDHHHLLVLPVRERFGVVLTPDLLDPYVWQDDVVLSADDGSYRRAVSFSESERLNRRAYYFAFDINDWGKRYSLEIRRKSREGRAAEVDVLFTGQLLPPPAEWL